MVERKQYLQELKQWKDDDVIKFLTLRYDGDYTPDEDEYEEAPASIKSEQRKKPVDVFDLIFGL